MRRAWRAFCELFEDDDPAEPRYDPVHVATVLVVTQVVIGALFWLLWTLLVFEGGIALKLGRLLNGPRDADSLEGLWGNLAAAAIAAAIIALLYRADPPDLSRRRGR